MTSNDSGGGAAFRNGAVKEHGQEDFDCIVLSHPYFWSVFVAYGEMDAMDLGSVFSIYFWFLLGLVALGILLFIAQKRSIA